MKRKKHILLTLSLAVAGGTLMAADVPDLSKYDLSKLPPPSDKTGLTFASDIQPLLKASCVRCHSGDRPKAGLRLDSVEAALKGSRDNKVIVPGDSKKSLLVVAIARIDDEVAMPPKHRPRRGPGGPGGPPPGGPGDPPPGGPGAGGPPPGGPGRFGPPPPPLTTEQVGLVRAWIDQGAK